MFRKLIYLLLILIVNFGCSKEDPTISKPAKHEKSFEIYKEAVASLEAGDYFYASKKFAEAETILPKIEFAAKASIMSSYCLYSISFYDEAILKKSNGDTMKHKNPKFRKFFGSYIRCS